MIQIPLVLFMAQWVLLFALGGLIVVAYRQLGFILHLDKIDKDIGTEKDGIAIGKSAPSFMYQPANRRSVESKAFPFPSEWSLLLFADPGCVSCQDALRALEKIIAHLPQSMRILVATSSEPSLITAVDEFRTTSVEVGMIEREVMSKIYQTHSTPFMYIIDSSSVIQAKGHADSENAMKKLIKVVSPQADHHLVQIGLRNNSSNK